MMVTTILMLMIHLKIRVMSTESGSFASARTVVQLYLDNKDLGQVMRL